jgi:hypothetical protein
MQMAVDERVSVATDSTLKRCCPDISALTLVQIAVEANPNLSRWQASAAMEDDMKRIYVWTGVVVCAAGLVLGVSATAFGGHQDDGSQEWTHGCTEWDLRGTYGFSREGTTTQGPLAAVGVASFDGKGFFTVGQTTSRNGVFTQGSFDGLYEVNADCTGKWLGLDGQTVTAYFVLVGHGEELLFLSASAGNTVTGISKRIARRYQR